MKAAIASAFFFPSPRKAVGRVGSYREIDVSRGGGLCSPPNFPHPRPLPATRYARGGRGAVAPRKGGA